MDCAVNPVWNGGDNNKDTLLACCYSESLKLTHRHEITSIAFPAISTGVYRFPKERAAKIAISQTLEWLTNNNLPHRVIFCCFSDDDAAVYEEVIGSDFQK